MSSPAYHTLGDTLVKLTDVNVSYGNKQILKNVNAEIRDIIRPGCTTGQIVGFLGPSGIGKSTLFECIAGLKKPTSGEVLLGKPLAPVTVGKVGVVQQNYPLFDHRTVWGNMEVAASVNGNRKLTKAERHDKIADALERFGLTQQRDQFPQQLSGGQRQRAAIAQQLICSEHFLLLDEPFSGLDVNVIKEVSRTLTEVANRDEINTIIIVSHDISATAALADTLWVMGRDRNPDNSIVPGAYIKHVFNLMERGLTWEESSHENPDFALLVHEVRCLFPTL